MLLQTIASVVLATEEHEGSKAFFYIAGGGLAAFAVLLGALGMTQPDFPKTDGAAKGVMGIGFVLMVVAMVSAVVTA